MLKSFLGFNLILMCSVLMSSCTSFDGAKRDDHNTVNNQKSWLRPGLLTSDRIKEKFGSFGVQVLSQDEQSGVRLSNLYSEHDGEKVTRTFALVTFSSAMDKNLLPAHKEILDGGSIGTTLSKHGFQLQKNIVYQGLADEMPKKVGVMMRSDQDKFAISIYDLVVKIDGKSLPYCTITELYSPDFLTVNELNQLYQTVRSDANAPGVDERLSTPASPKKANEILNLIRTTTGFL